jgi:hypothetical protein
LLAAIVKTKHDRLAKPSRKPVESNAHVSHYDSSSSEY